MIAFQLVLSSVLGLLVSNTFACQPSFYYNQKWLGFNYNELSPNDFEYLNDAESYLIKTLKLKKEDDGLLVVENKKCPKVPGALYQKEIERSEYYFYINDGVRFSIHVELKM